MSKLMQSVMATSGPDKRNESFNADDLQRMAEGINGQVAMRVGLEHNRTLPPTGKVLRASVEVNPTGDMRVSCVSEIFSAPIEIELPDGTTGFIQKSESDARPFLEIHTDAEDEFIITTDYINFGSVEHWNEFFEEVRQQTDQPILSKQLGRKSFIPHPEIVISVTKALSEVISLTVIGKKLVDALTDKLGKTVSEDFDKLYRITRSAVWASLKRLTPQHRTPIYVIEVSGKPHMSFVAETRDAELFLKAVNAEAFDSALANLEDLCKTFDPSDVQYLLDDDGNWKFNYLLTGIGQSIGTRKAFSRRNVVLRELAKVQAPINEVSETPDIQTEYDALVEKVYAPGQAMSVAGIADSVSQMPQGPSEQQQRNSTAS